MNARSGSGGVRGEGARGRAIQKPSLSPTPHPFPPNSAKNPLASRSSYCLLRVRDSTLNFQSAAMAGGGGADGAADARNRAVIEEVLGGQGAAGDSTFSGAIGGETIIAAAIIGADVIDHNIVLEANLVVVDSHAVEGGRRRGRCGRIDRRERRLRRDRHHRDGSGRG